MNRQKIVHPIYASNETFAANPLRRSSTMPTRQHPPSQFNASEYAANTPLKPPRSFTSTEMLGSDSQQNHQTSSNLSLNFLPPFPSKTLPQMRQDYEISIIEIRKGRRDQPLGLDLTVKTNSLGQTSVYIKGIDEHLMVSKDSHVGDLLSAGDEVLEINAIPVYRCSRNSIISLFRQPEEQIYLMTRRPKSRVNRSLSQNSLKTEKIRGRAVSPLHHASRSSSSSAVPKRAVSFNELNGNKSSKVEVKKHFMRGFRFVACPPLCLGRKKDKRSLSNLSPIMQKKKKGSKSVSFDPQIKHIPTVVQDAVQNPETQMPVNTDDRDKLDDFENVDFSADYPELFLQRAMEMKIENMENGAERVNGSASSIIQSLRGSEDSAAKDENDENATRDGTGDNASRDGTGDNASRDGTDNDCDNLCENAGDIQQEERYDFRISKERNLENEIEELFEKVEDEFAVERISPSSYTNNSLASVEHDESESETNHRLRSRRTSECSEEGEKICHTSASLEEIEPVDMNVNCERIMQSQYELTIIENDTVDRRTSEIKDCDPVDQEADKEDTYEFVEKDTATKEAIADLSDEKINIASTHSRHESGNSLYLDEVEERSASASEPETKFNPSPTPENFENLTQNMNTDTASAADQVVQNSWIPSSLRSSPLSLTDGSNTLHTSEQDGSFTSSSSPTTDDSTKMWDLPMRNNSKNETNALDTSEKLTNDNLTKGELIELHVLNTSWNLGLTVANIGVHKRLILSHISSQSPLNKEKRFKVGDELIVVNSENVEGQDSKRVNKLLAALPRGLVTLTIAKSDKNGLRTRSSTNDSGVAGDCDISQRYSSTSNGYSRTYTQQHTSTTVIKNTSASGNYFLPNGHRNNLTNYSAMTVPDKNEQFLNDTSSRNEADKNYTTRNIPVQVDNLVSSHASSRPLSSSSSISSNSKSPSNPYTMNRALASNGFRKAFNHFETIDDNRVVSSVRFTPSSYSKSTTVLNGKLGEKHDCINRSPQAPTRRKHESRDKSPIFSQPEPTKSRTINSQPNDKNTEWTRSMPSGLNNSHFRAVPIYSTAESKPDLTKDDVYSTSTRSIAAPPKRVNPRAFQPINQKPKIKSTEFSKGINVRSGTVMERMAKFEHANDNAAPQKVHVEPLLSKGFGAPKESVTKRYVQQKDIGRQKTSNAVIYSQDKRNNVAVGGKVQNFETPCENVEQEVPITRLKTPEPVAPARRKSPKQMLNNSNCASVHFGAEKMEANAKRSVPSVNVEDFESRSPTVSLTTPSSDSSELHNASTTPPPTDLIKSSAAHHVMELMPAAPVRTAKEYGLHLDGEKVDIKQLEQVENNAEPQLVKSKSRKFSAIDISEMQDEAADILDDESAEIYTVIIERPECQLSGGVGLVLATIEAPNEELVVVNKVITHSLAHRLGQINVGDRVLVINGTPIRGMSHRDALKILKAPSPDVVIVLARSNNESESDESRSVSRTDNSIKVIKVLNNSEGLGIGIEGGRGGPSGDRPLTIRRIYRDSPASKCSLLGVGDEIMELNDKNCENLSRYDMWNLLKVLPANEEVIMKIRKSVL